MKLRCELHLNTGASKVILVARPEETLDHLALKLAAYTLFHAGAPIVEPSSDHPSLLGFDHKPDLFLLNAAGEIDTWIECGAVTVNKLNKLTRRLTSTRFVVLKTSRNEAARLRSALEGEVRYAPRVEIWTWPDNAYAVWRGALAEKTEIFGEASERSFNLVVNHTPYAVDLVAL